MSRPIPTRPTVSRRRASRRRTFLGGTVLTALLLVPGLGCSRPAPAEEVVRPHLVLVSIDTLRADHLQPYGYDQPTSPHLDAFRADAVLFSQAIAHAPSTLPSHASLFSSLLPQQHGASFARRAPLPDAAVTLTETLAALGYETAAFGGAGQLAPEFGVYQGFEHLEILPAAPFHRVVGRALDWLDGVEDRGEAAPLFLFLHSYEVHAPYTPWPDHLAAVEPDYAGPLPPEISHDLLDELNARRGELTDADRAHVVATYDAEIRGMDAAFGWLVDGLKERGLYDGALVAFTSDHGEEMGEHGFLGAHAHTLYDELLRVPLLVKFPENRWAPARVDAQVRSVDVAPTLLAAAGGTAPGEWVGRPLQPLARGEESAHRLAVSWQDDPRRQVESLRLGDRKLVRETAPDRKRPRLRLFDLAADPGERRGRAGDAELRRDLARQLDALVSEREPLQATTVVPSDETDEQLRALGYLD